jgi:hypothetical protein
MDLHHVIDFSYYILPDVFIDDSRTDTDHKIRTLISDLHISIIVAELRCRWHVISFTAISLYLSMF